MEDEVGCGFTNQPVSQPSQRSAVWKVSFGPTRKESQVSITFGSATRTVLVATSERVAATTAAADIRPVTVAIEFRECTVPIVRLCVAAAAAAGEFSSQMFQHSERG